MLNMIKVSSSQFNYLYGNQIHFPYSIARLIAYVKTNNQLSSNFQFLLTQDRESQETLKQMRLYWVSAR